MSLFGPADQANNAPKFKPFSDIANTGVEQYGNTSVGVFGVDAAEKAVTPGPAHRGWVARRPGTGPVASLAIGDGGTDYANADTITITGGTINATANLSTNSTGGIISISNLRGGAGFENTADANVEITTSTGSGANLVVTLGGRANRVSYETLVALKITGDGSDDTQFPDS